MKISPLKASKPGHIVCPTCGLGELGHRGSQLTVCDYCGLSTNGAVLTTDEPKSQSMHKTAVYATAAILLATAANLLHAMPHAGQNVMSLEAWQ